MATVNYRGKSVFFINGYKIIPGNNEIPDEDFNTMMKSKTFKSRVDQNILEVKGGLPQEKKAPDMSMTQVKPIQSAHADIVKQSVREQRQESVKPEKHSEYEGVSGLRETLAEIEQTENTAFLKDLIDNDERQKVVDAAKKRLKTLKGH